MPVREDFLRNQAEVIWPRPCANLYYPQHYPVAPSVSMLQYIEDIIKRKPAALLTFQLHSATIHHPSLGICPEKLLGFLLLDTKQLLKGSHVCIAAGTSFSPSSISQSIRRFKSMTFLF